MNPIQPEIKILESKSMIGKSMEMSLMENHTAVLWKDFMQNRKLIDSTISEEKYSIQFYPADYFKSFNPAAKFTKKAACELLEESEAVDGFEQFKIEEGLYAVFLYKGLLKDFPPFMNYIFQKWLPSSAYQLDHRPHFEKLDERYLGTNHPDSQEEVWIPIRPK